VVLMSRATLVVLGDRHVVLLVGAGRATHAGLKAG